MATKKTAFDKIYSNLKAPRKTKIELHGEFLEGIEIEILNTLDLETALEFAVGLSNACASLEDAEYTPESYPFALSTGVLMYYTNLKLPDSQEKVYRVIQETDLLAQIMPHINLEQFEEIKQVAQQRINFVRNTLSSMAGVRSIDLMNRLAEVVTATEQMASQLSGVDFAGAVNKLQDMGIMAKAAQEAPAESTAKVLRMIRPESGE